MTITLQDIPSLLLDPVKFSYLQELLYLSNNNNQEERINDAGQEIRLLNTLELFTFGNYLDYIKYKDEHYIELDEPLLVKLIKLTIISINNDYCNQIISFDKVNQEYGLHVREVYPIIIELNFKNLISIQIDDVHNVLALRGKKVLRDVYNCDNYSLRVLNEDEDLGVNRLVRLSKLKIQQWINETLIPVKTDLENRIASLSLPQVPTGTKGTSSSSSNSNTYGQDYRLENTRKRKTPDNI